jgi:hypothetical protein
LYFGYVGVGTTGSAKTITLTNNQTTSLTITSIKASSGFAAASSCPSSVAPGGKCNINVTFMPVQLGAWSGTLTVVDSANTSPQKVNLTGIGTLASLISISVTPQDPSVPAKSTQQFTATGHFPGSITLNLTARIYWESSATSIATISNSSGKQGLATAIAAGTTKITAKATAEAAAEDTAEENEIIGSTSLTVTATAPTLVSIAVTPVNPSIAKGTTQQFAATGTYSDATTKTITSSVTWTSGTLSVATITAGGLAAGAGVGTSNITASLSGVTSPADVLTVTPSTLVIQTTSLPDGQQGTSYSASVTVTGGTPPYTWAITGGALPVGVTINSSTGLLSGTPIVAGSYTFAVQVNDAGTQTATAALSINILAPVVSLPASSSLTFASQTIGTTSASQTVTVTNNGSEALTIASIVLSGTNASDYAQSNACPISPSTLGVGGSCAIAVTFSPLVVGSRFATITVTDNTGNVAGSQQVISLSGTGVAPPPSTTTIPLTFNPGTGVTQVATLNCPSNTNPCTDPQAHSFKLTIGTVATGFTLNVTAYEVSQAEANGVCENGNTEANDFDCRFTSTFPIGTQPNGDVIVPQCIPYSNGNCV